VTTLNSHDGPESFAEAYPSVVDEVLKNHFSPVLQASEYLRSAAVAGLWLGLVTRDSRDAAELLRQGILNDLEPYAAAKAVAKGLGWVPGQVIGDGEEGVLGT
jgi:hypothetical protein